MGFFLLLFSCLLVFLFCIQPCVRGQSLAFLNTQTTITCQSILLEWQGGVEPFQLTQETTGLPSNELGLGNTQSHTFTPDFTQVLAGDQFTFVIQDSQGNTATKQFASSTEGCSGGGTASSTSSADDVSTQASSTTTSSANKVSTQQTTSRSIAQTLVASASDSQTTITATPTGSASISVAAAIHNSGTTSLPISSSSTTSPSSPSSVTNSATSSPSSSTTSGTPIIGATTTRHIRIGAIVGGIIGGLVFILSLLAILYICKIRSSRNSRFRLMDAESEGPGSAQNMSNTTPVPFPIVSVVTGPGSGSETMLSPSSKKGDLTSPLSGPEEPGPENTDVDPDPDSLVPTLTAFSRGGDVDIETMQRRIDLLLAENARLAGIPPPSYSGLES